jgi:DHA1 family tetracycline resistance protein-like MFS transporter
LSTIGAALPYPILPPLFAAGASNGLNQFLGLPPKFLFSLALDHQPAGAADRQSACWARCRTATDAVPLLLTALGAAMGHAVTALALVLESYPLFIVARFASPG